MWCTEFLLLDEVKYVVSYDSMLVMWIFKLGHSRSISKASIYLHVVVVGEAEQREPTGEQKTLIRVQHLWPGGHQSFIIASTCARYQRYATLTAIMKC